MIPGRNLQSKRRALNPLPDSYKVDTSSLHGAHILSRIQERGGTAMARVKWEELAFADFASAPRGTFSAMLRRLRKQQRQQIPIWRDPQSATGLSLPLACVCFGGPPSTWYSRYWLEDQPWPDLACRIGRLGKQCAGRVMAVSRTIGARWLPTFSRQPLWHSRGFRST
jgi:hypothetical protein